MDQTKNECVARLRRVQISCCTARIVMSLVVRHVCGQSQARMGEKDLSFRSTNDARDKFKTTVVRALATQKPKASAHQLNRECKHCYWLDRKSPDHFMLHSNSKRNYSPRKSTESYPFTYWLRFTERSPHRNRQSERLWIIRLLVGRFIHIQLTCGK